MQESRSQFYQKLLRKFKISWSSTIMKQLQNPCTLMQQYWIPVLNLIF